MAFVGVDVDVVVIAVFIDLIDQEYKQGEEGELMTQCCY